MATFDLNFTVSYHMTIVNLSDIISFSMFTLFYDRLVHNLISHTTVSMEKPIETVGSNTYQTIKQDIIFGALSPGSKLKLGFLKDSYDASFSTLRETLSRLSSEGFVASEQQRGFFVTPVSREDLTEISNLRILLECHALELSVNQGNADWEGNLVAGAP